MQFPESWLREFCNPPLSTRELADTLTMAGFEVEDLRPVAPSFSQVLVAEIKEAAQHPNADRLRVCLVDAGPVAGLLRIVCGAPNARVGIKIPCAVVGAVLPPAKTGDANQPFQIKQSQLRGVESQGMLCSARELGISEEGQGLMELPADAPLGQDLRQYLQLDDTVFTLKLTPNLGHALSVYGLARELSALTGAALQTPAGFAVPAQIEDRWPVRVLAADLCGRFAGRVLKGINPQAITPQWMLARLARCGQRSVSALVDISNYLMFEYGQPTHVFDLDKIQGALQVRWAKPGESLQLLNGQSIELDEQVGVIADDAAVESLAGIMGGQATAVSDDTRNIYIEAAFWWPQAVAGRSRRFNFSTDAGHRFERGVDPIQVAQRLERLTHLIQSICGGQAGPLDDQQINMPAIPHLSLRVSRAARVIGMDLSPAQCQQALEALGLSVEVDAADSQRLKVRPPPHRFDLNIEEDLIEEVARMVGYQNLPHTPSLAATKACLRAETQRNPFDVKRQLAALAYQETINFSFVQESWERDLAGNTAPIRLLNPIASPLSVMRSSLLGSLLEVLQRNVHRKLERVRLFEVGRVFLRDPAQEASLSAVAGVAQPLRLAGLAYGPVYPTQWDQAERKVDFFDVKADVQALLGRSGLTFKVAQHPALHPGRCAAIEWQGRLIGHLGELHPQWRQQFDLTQAPVLFEVDWAAVLQRDVPRFQSVSRFHPVQRDLSVVVADAVTHEQLMRCVADVRQQVPSVREAVLFDVYKPKAGTAAAGLLAQEKSLSLRLHLWADEQPMTEAEIDAAVQQVLDRLAQQLQARLRA